MMFGPEPDHKEESDESRDHDVEDKHVARKSFASDADVRC